MASKLRNDILIPLEIEPLETRPEGSKLTAFVPIAVALIGIGAVAVTLVGQPGAGITTGITTAVVMVVAGMSPHNAWLQPILRLLDTIVGLAVGIVAAWISCHIRSRTLQRAEPNEPAAQTGVRM